MKDLEIDQYLAEVNVVVDDLGGQANFVGLCQGGWISAMYAARFPHKVASLVLAGAPIDTDAGNGPVKGMARTLPMFDLDQGSLARALPGYCRRSGHLRRRPA